MTREWPPLFRSRSFDATPTAVRQARVFMERACKAAHASPSATEVAVLLTSELMANAVLHGEGSPIVDVQIAAGLVHVAVRDDSPRLPQVQPEDRTANSGRGLFLVDALAAHWGIAPCHPFGKSVWFEVEE